MTTRNPRKDALMGQRDALSFYDIKAVNMEYNCKGSCTNRCDNGGYPFQKGGRCICICPEGLTGNRCENVEHGGYPRSSHLHLLAIGDAGMTSLYTVSYTSSITDQSRSWIVISLHFHCAVGVIK